MAVSSTRDQRLAAALDAKKAIQDLEERFIAPFSDELRSISVQQDQGFTLTSPGRGSVQVSKPGADKSWDEIEVSPTLSESRIQTLIKQGILVKVQKFRAGSKPSVTFKVNV